MCKKNTECSWCGQSHEDDPNHIWTTIYDCPGHLFSKTTSICEDCITLSYEGILELRKKDIEENNRIITDPNICFGSPVEATSGVPTCALYELYKDDMSVEGIAEVYEMTVAAVKYAIWYEVLNPTGEEWPDSNDEEAFEEAYGAQLLGEVPFPLE